MEIFKCVSVGTKIPTANFIYHSCNSLEACWPNQSPLVLFQHICAQQETHGFFYLLTCACSEIKHIQKMLGETGQGSFLYGMKINSLCMCKEWFCLETYMDGLLWDAMANHVL